MYRSSQYGAICGVLAVAARSLPKAVETAVPPKRARPFAFTENWVCRTPTNQNSNPMFVTAEALSSKLAATRLVVPVDMSSKATEDPVVNG